MSQENGNNWEMPEPIFRRSTGELVKPKDDQGYDPEHDTLEPSPPAASGAADDPLARLYAPPDAVTETPSPGPSPADAPIDLEPQPLISEEFTADRIVIDEILPKAKRSGRPVFFTLGLIVVIGVLAVFIALVYYLFFMGRPNTGGF